MSDAAEQANVALDEWSEEEKRWSLGLAAIAAIQVVSLHVDGREASPEQWERIRGGILWKGVLPKDAQRAYVTLRVAAPRGRLTDAKLGLIGVLVTALAGASGAWIQGSNDTCREERRRDESALKDARAAQQEAGRIKDECRTSLVQVAKLCAGDAAAHPQNPPAIARGDRP